MCHFVLVFFSPFSIAFTSLGEERANLSAFRTFVRFVLVWICRFPLLLGVWEGLWFVILALPGLFSYLFFFLNLKPWYASSLDLQPWYGLWIYGLYFLTRSVFFVSKGNLFDVYRYALGLDLRSW